MLRERLKNKIFDNCAVREMGVTKKWSGGGRGGGNYQTKNGVGGGGKGNACQ